jgi:hypothetical protein
VYEVVAWQHDKVVWQLTDGAFLHITIGPTSCPPSAPDPGDVRVEVHAAGS